jgi:hypothetical protein
MGQIAQAFVDRLRQRKMNHPLYDERPSLIDDGGSRGSRGARTNKRGAGATWGAG